MRVFISWSGSESRAVAEALHWWLPKVLQGTVPFVSAKDIDKGANWTVELARELETCEFGIVCVTPDNRASPWLNYETGAITKSVSSRVCPVLHGLDKSEVNAPLAQLQLTSLDQEDVFLMMRSMNLVAGSKLSEPDLREAVDVWWPQLTERLATISPPDDRPMSNASPAEPEQPYVSDRELLEDLLGLVRGMQRERESAELAGRSRQRLKMDEQVPSELLSDVRNVLMTDNIPVERTAIGQLTILLGTVTVPAPLPAKSFNALGELARLAKREVILSGGDGTRTRFNSDGISDEPPF